jgi:hypothetical protein
MASKVVSMEHRGNVVIVTVRHLDSDSFSRSVQRAATKAWHTLPRETQRATRFLAADFAHDSTGRECVSTLAFGPSFDSAYAALEGVTP